MRDERVQQSKVNYIQWGVGYWKGREGFRETGGKKATGVWYEGRLIQETKSKKMDRKMIDCQRNGTNKV